MSKPSNNSSELDKILAEHWSDLRVVETGSPGTRSNAHRKAKRRIEALIAKEVLEGQIEVLQELWDEGVEHGIDNRIAGLKSKLVKESN